MNAHRCRHRCCRRLAYSKINFNRVFSLSQRAYILTLHLDTTYLSPPRNVVSILFTMPLDISLSAESARLSSIVYIHIYMCVCIRLDNNGRIYTYSDAL